MTNEVDSSVQRLAFTISGWRRTALAFTNFLGSCCRRIGFVPSGGLVKLEGDPVIWRAVSRLKRQDGRLRIASIKSISIPGLCHLTSLIIDLNNPSFESYFYSPCTWYFRRTRRTRPSNICHTHQLIKRNSRNLLLTRPTHLGIQINGQAGIGEIRKSTVRIDKCRCTIGSK